MIEAEKRLGKEVDLAFEDILSTEEIQKAYDRVDEIEEQFSKATGILNKKDLSFLAVATALQVVKWVMLPKIGEIEYVWILECFLGKT